jgi:hypothetical protein
MLMTTTTAQAKLIKEVRLRLGGGMIDLPLDPEHYDLAFELAIDRYRLRSGNASEESFLFMTFQPDQSVYTLPNEVEDVHDIYRRGVGAGGGGATVDPFSMAFTNSIYLLQSPGGLQGGGSLATYEMASQFQELIGRMFGKDIQFTWNRATHRLQIERKISAAEEVCLHVWNTKPAETLLADTLARPWIRDYTSAQCKLMLGEAYSKFSTIGGPQGGFSLNGDAMKTEALADLERLENEIKAFVDNTDGMPFIIAGPWSWQ